uniref:Uncharacterized protein n=1 Tax=Plasmopara viticola TaxID=143451 RepID=A0A6C0NA28_PLAVT|nr:hypothetical protein [Plasmopara viticola]QHW07466.1 hypothetical protein [Plasmopara viticola]
MNNGEIKLKYQIMNLERQIMSLENSCEVLILNQRKIIKDLEEIKRYQAENQEMNYYKYSVLKNIMLVLILLGSIGFNWWVYYYCL